MGLEQRDAGRWRFDTIPQAQLRERAEANIADGRVLALVEAFLKQGVLEEMNLWTPEAGTPQGEVSSPLLSIAAQNGWVRMRLRSLLRRRRGGGGRGPGRGADHQRWGRSFFAEQGLFSLVTAHAAACESSRR